MRRLAPQRGVKPLTGEQARVSVDAGTRWAWMLEDELVAIYEAQILAAYDNAARLLSRIGRRSAKSVAAASPPAGWSIPDPDELGLSLREQMDARHAQRQQGEAASDVIRADAIRRTTAAGLQIMGVSLSARNALVEGVLRDQLGGKIVGIRETTRRDIMSSLESSWRDGDSIPRAAKALRAEAPGIAASRSRTIARTELLAAVNGGAHALAALSDRYGGEQGQAPLLKIWLTAQDERVRDDHVDAGADYGSGSGIPMDQPFIVGGAEMMFPGDPNGPADEVINCRCAISYEESDEPAPDQESVVAEEIASTTAPSTMEDLARLTESLNLVRRTPGEVAEAAEMTPEERLAALRSTPTEDLLREVAETQPNRPAEPLPEPPRPLVPEETPEETMRRMNEEAAAQDRLARAVREIGAERREERGGGTFRSAEGNEVRVDRSTPEWDNEALVRMFGSEALADNGYVTQAQASRDTFHGVTDVHVHAFINDPATGQEVAEIERHINFADASVKHDIFFIAPEYQGMGIAKDILRSSVDEYDRTGITKIHVGTAQVGRYTWSRFGFDYNTANGLASGRAALRKAIFERAERARILPRDLDVTNEAAIERALGEAFPETMAKISTVEHSWEVGGFSINEGGLDVPDLGKQAMLHGPSWTGTLDLTPGSETRRIFDAYTA